MARSFASGVPLFFGVALLVCIFGVSLPAAAQTPDSQTPAEETICSKLKFATPGLYGLCVAYCESHDADFDPVTGMPNSGSPANKKILENYNKKKQPSDPDMPCVKVACPCFDAEDLAALDTSAGGSCFDASNQTPPVVVLSGIGADKCKDAAFVQGLTCTYINTGIADKTTTCGTIAATKQEITLEQFKTCADLIRTDATRRRLTCSLR